MRCSLANRRFLNGRIISAPTLILRIHRNRSGIIPPPRRYYNSSANFNRIPPVLAKPKPPPFNKGGFYSFPTVVRQCHSERSEESASTKSIFNFQLIIFSHPGSFLHADNLRRIHSMILTKLPSADSTSTSSSFPPKCFRVL